MPADLLAKVTGLHHASGTGGSERTLSRTTLPDVDVRVLTQRDVGLTLVGKIIDHVLSILTGADRDGKDALVHTMAAAVGSYAVQASQTCSGPRTSPPHRPARPEWHPANYVQ